MPRRSQRIQGRETPSQATLQAMSRQQLEEEAARLDVTWTGVADATLRSRIANAAARESAAPRDAPMTKEAAGRITAEAAPKLTVARLRAALTSLEVPFSRNARKSALVAALKRDIRARGRADTEERTTRTGGDTSGGKETEPPAAAAQTSQRDEAQEELREELRVLRAQLASLQGSLMQHNQSKSRLPAPAAEASVPRDDRAEAEVDLTRNPQPGATPPTTRTHAPRSGAGLGFITGALAKDHWYSANQFRFSPDRAQTIPSPGLDGLIDWSKQGGFTSREELDAYVAMIGASRSIPFTLSRMWAGAKGLQAQGEPWVPVIQHWTTVVALGLRAAGGHWDDSVSQAPFINTVRAMATTFKPRRALLATPARRQRNTKRKRDFRDQGRSQNGANAGPRQRGTRAALYCPHHPDANSHDEASCWRTHPELRPSARRKQERSK